MAAVLLSFLLRQPGQMRSSLVPIRDRRMFALQNQRVGGIAKPDYGLPVSPYKAANIGTLELVANGGESADAEWQDFVLKLAVQLRRHRLDCGLSQEEVAHRAGLSRFIYRQYESGESRRGTAANPALRSILAIAQVFQVPIEQLLPEQMPDLRSR
ncbi:helix-turn-helix domain-containing protein [Microbacterium sp. NPDC055599]